MPCSNFNLEVLLPLSPTPSSSESPYIYLQICPTIQPLLTICTAVTCTASHHLHWSKPLSFLSGSLQSPPNISLLLLLPAFKLFWTQQPEWPCPNQVRCLHSSAQHPDRASLLPHWPPRTTWPAPLPFLLCSPSPYAILLQTLTCLLFQEHSRHPPTLGSLLQQSPPLRHLFDSLLHFLQVSSSGAFSAKPPQHSYVTLQTSPTGTLYPLFLLPFPQHLQSCYLLCNELFITFIVCLRPSEYTWVGILIVLIAAKSWVHRAVPGTRSVPNTCLLNWHCCFSPCCNYEIASQRCGFWHWGIPW